MDRMKSRHIGPDFQFARFSLGGNEFGIEVRKVKEIIRPRETSKGDDCPSFLEGFIRLRDIAVPVLDLRKRFSLPFERTKNARIIIISVDGLIAGLLVDEVNDITAGGTQITAALPSSDPWYRCVEAVVEWQGTTVLIINPSALLTTDEKRILGEPFTEG